MRVLDELIDRKRRQAAEQATTAAEQTQRELEGMHPVLVELSAENAALSRDVNDITQRLQAQDLVRQNLEQIVRAARRRLPGCPRNPGVWRGQRRSRPNPVAAVRRPARSTGLCSKRRTAQDGDRRPHRAPLEASRRGAAHRGYRCHRRAAGAGAAGLVRETEATEGQVAGAGAATPDTARQDLGCEQPLPRQAAGARSGRAGVARDRRRV